MEYLILNGYTRTDLEFRVREEISRGWNPAGGIVITRSPQVGMPDGVDVLLQAMTRGEPVWEESDNLRTVNAELHRILEKIRTAIKAHPQVLPDAPNIVDELIAERDAAEKQLTQINTILTHIEVDVLVKRRDC